MFYCQRVEAPLPVWTGLDRIVRADSDCGSEPGRDRLCRKGRKGGGLL